MTIRTESSGSCTVGVDDGGTYISNSSDYVYIKNGEIKINNNTLLTSNLSTAPDDWEYVGTWFPTAAMTSITDVIMFQLNANSCGYYFFNYTRSIYSSGVWTNSQYNYIVFIAPVKINGSFSRYDILEVSNGGAAALISNFLFVSNSNLYTKLMKKEQNGTKWFYYASLYKISDASTFEINYYTF